MINKNIKAILTLILIFTLGQGTVFAQTDSAKQILHKAEKVIFAEGKATVAHFTSTLYAPNATQSSENRIDGEITMQGEDFRLTYGNITAVYHAGVLSYYDKSQNTLNISKPTEEQLIQINPLFFARSGAKGFNLSLEAPAKGYDIVLFVPQKKMNITKMIISFDHKTGLPHNVVVVGTDHSRLVLTVSAFETKAAYPKDYYQLNKNNYPSADVVDMT